MGRGAGGTAPLRAAGTPRGGASGRGGHQPAALGTASAHLDEELDEGLFVLLLQSVQGHRQRHGQLGWAPRTAAAAVAPGLLWLRVPTAGSLAHWTVRASSCPWLRSSAPPHASRATLRGLRSLPLQTAGRSPVGVAWAEQWPSAIGSCGGRGNGGPSRRAWPRGRTAGERSSIGRPTKGAQPRRGVPSPAPSQAGGKGSRSPSLTRSPSTAQLLLVGAK